MSTNEETTAPIHPRDRDALSIIEYRDSAKHWRWRITHTSNGEIVGASTQGYVLHEACTKNLYLITGWTPDGQEKSEGPFEYPFTLDVTSFDGDGRPRYGEEEYRQALAYIGWRLGLTGTYHLIFDVVKAFDRLMEADDRSCTALRLQYIEATHRALTQATRAFDEAKSRMDAALRRSKKVPS